MGAESVTGISMRFHSAGAPLHRICIPAYTHRIPKGYPGASSCHRHKIGHPGHPATMENDNPGRDMLLACNGRESTS